MTDFLPSLATYERERLKESIMKHGVKHAILVLKDGRIIDGLNRWEIAKELDKECPIAEVDLSDDDAFALGVSLNLDRRQLSKAQIDAIREGQKKVALELRRQGKTQEEIAKITGLGRSTISELENNIANNVGSDNTCNDMPDVRVKIPKAEHEKIIERYKKGETQEQIAADYKVQRQRISQIIKKEERTQRKTSEAIANLKVEAKIQNSNATDFLNTLVDKSVDLLLTDPPYSTEFEAESFEIFVQNWLPLALSKLKETGQAYIFIGAYPWELRTYLNILYEHKQEYGEIQLLVWTYKNTIGPNPKNHYFQNWQTIIYIRGKKALELNIKSLLEGCAVQEFNAPDGRNGTRYHQWEKPLDLAKRLILHSATKTSVVVDPFAGTGTFLLAASELGLENIGSEIDQKIIDIAITRGCIQTG